MLEEDPLAQATSIDVGILSERLEMLALDQELRRRMGQAAKQYVEKHCSWRVVVKRYEELWEESLQAARAVRSMPSESSKILSLSLKKSFGHYATATRSQDCRCFITPEGQEWLRRPARFYFLCPLSTRPYPRRFAEMLREISVQPGLSIESLVQAYFNESDPASVPDAHWTVARLFKYGLVTDKQDNPAPLTSSAWSERC